MSATASHAARALAASSQREKPADAVLEVGARLRSLGFDKTAPATALVFCSVHLARDPVALSDALVDILGEVPFIGFVGASAFHDVRLRERRAGLAVLVLPATNGTVRSVRLEGALPHTAREVDEIASSLVADIPRGAVRLLSVALDPSSTGSTLDFLSLLDEQGVPLAGGLALAPSGQLPSVIGRGVAPGNAAVMLDLQDVGVVFGVAQAARALGPVRTVTAASNNVIEELDGRRATDALVDDLPPSLRPQMTNLSGSLCAGFSTEGGDTTLVRNIIGIDQKSGTVAVAARPRVGSEIVFSVRDGRSAREDLDELLRAMREALGKRVPRAFVVFSCIGRDEGLFGTPSYDAQAILARFGTQVPVVGCSTAGELCTYGIGTYLFGTSCVIAAIL